MSRASEAPPRRRRSNAEKRRIVEESLEPGASVARVARAHVVNPNQVFQWRKLYREGRLEADPEPRGADWLPVRLADLAPETPRGNRSAPPGAIEVELPRGRLRVEGLADPSTLRLLVELLRA
jgi:transposase